MAALLLTAAVAAVTAARWRRSGQPLVDYLGIGLVYLYARLWHRWSSNGPAPLPPRGPAILVANHTCSSDPAFLTAGCPRVLSFLLAREFYHVPLLRRLLDYMGCVPVTRNGRDAAAVRVALRRLAEGRVVCVFPEGGLGNAGKRSPRGGKAGIAAIALHSRVPVYPALITEGPQTNALLRAWLRPSRVRLIFGPPLDLTAFLDRPIDRKLLEAVTRHIMEQVAALTAKESSRFKACVSRSPARKELERTRDKM